MCTSAAPLLFPTPVPCHDCREPTEGTLLAGVRVPLCLACLTRTVVSDAGPSMVRAISLDLEPVAFEYVGYAPVDAERAVVERAAERVEKAVIATITGTVAPLPTEDPESEPVRNRVLRHRANTFSFDKTYGGPDTGFHAILSGAADGSGADSVDQMDSVDALADSLSAYDRQRIKIFLRGGTSLPSDVAKRIRERVGLPRMCHLFGLPHPSTIATNYA